MGRFTGPARWPETSTGKRSVQAARPGTPAPPAPDPVPEGPDATDAAKALAAEHGVDLASVTGTGAEGRITKDDVASVVAAATEEPHEPVPDEADEQPDLDE